MVDRFGTPPAGVACPEALFVQPVWTNTIAIVRAADRPGGGLRFHFLILDRELYRALNDPFAIADQFPVDWQDTGSLPPLEWTTGPLPARQVADLRPLIRHEDAAFYLGGAQVLVDDGRLLLERSAPDAAVARDLWSLLPSRTRSEKWLATFAFSPALNVHLWVRPPSDNGPLRGYTTAEQARDYPVSRYEESLELAITSDDQEELDRLLSRRSSREAMRMAIWLLLGMMLLGLVIRILNGVKG